MGMARASGPHSVIHSVMFAPSAIAAARATSIAKDIDRCVESSGPRMGTH